MLNRYGVGALCAVLTVVLAGCNFGSKVDLNSDSEISEAAAKGGVKGKPPVTPAPTAPPVTPAPTVAPVATPVATATPRQTVAPTAVPTAAPTPAPTPVPAATPAPSASGVQFIQVQSTGLFTAQASVSATFGSAQSAGNTNVLAVGWADTAATITSVRDSLGNLYTLASSPVTYVTGGGAFSQAIYYAKNIRAASAGQNTVTISFSAAARYPDLRILEYRGIDPVQPIDVTVGAGGEGDVAASGSVVTRNANNLLFAASTSGQDAVLPGVGFTNRVITSLGSLAEDRVVPLAGTYNGTATLAAPGVWVMQLVAFRAAGSPPQPTPAPTAIPTATPAVTPVPITPGLVPAFPGAEGGGALSKGGRGGTVYFVTNLNDSGTGSLRACVQASGPRTCIFKVGGTIALQSMLGIGNPYITIAGQTAPGGGIQLTMKTSESHVLGIYTHDVVVRYLRIRHGYYNSSGNGAGIAIGGTAQQSTSNVILDHCSVQWSQDDLFSVYSWAGNIPVTNVTASWNLIAEPLKVHDTASINGCSNDNSLCLKMTNIDEHHNFYGNFGHRGPEVRINNYRFVNNIIYNWYTWASINTGSGMNDFVGNFYRRLRTDQAHAWYHEIEVYPQGNSDSSPGGSPSLHVAGNIGPNNSNPLNDNWGMLAQVPSEGWYECEVFPCNSSNIVVPSRTFQRSTPLPKQPIPITVTPLTAGGASLEDLLLRTGNAGGTVGASRRLTCDGKWVANYDAADSRILNGYPTQGTTPNTENDVGGFPVLAAGTACTDSNSNGIPDAYETARCGSATCLNAQTVGADGYTNLERYLNGI